MVLIYLIIRIKYNIAVKTSNVYSKLAFFKSIEYTEIIHYYGVSKDYIT